MTSSGPTLVAVPAMVLPVDAALVLMTAGEVEPPRVDAAEPTAARVEACADLCGQMKPQFEATYLLKLLYKAPLLASRVRLELLSARPCRAAAASSRRRSSRPRPHRPAAT